MHRIPHPHTLDRDHSRKIRIRLLEIGHKLFEADAVIGLDIVVSGFPHDPRTPFTKQS